MLFSNFWTRLQFEWRKQCDFGRVAFRYYSHPIFRKVDLALLLSYFGANPYRISRRFLKMRGAQEIYAFGETPLTTLEQICKEAELNHTDTIYELGCGRGRTCFWLALILKAKVIGIDYVPAFIEKAQKIARAFSLSNPTFLCENFLNSDLVGASAIYLNGTCMHDSDIQKLIQKLNLLPKGTKLITVSFPITDYPQGQKWQLSKSFSATFSWGEAEVYVQLLKMRP